ncbi:MAG: ferredoxin reductase domain-containing protein [Planctomycetota bacterium]
MTHPSMRLSDLDTDTRVQATLVSSERITPEESPEEVRELVLDLDRELPLAVGQSLGVLAPAPPTFGQEHHLRLYSVADIPTHSPDGKLRITLCVRRCEAIDEYSGERYPGVASNYLCDLSPGQQLTLTGPYGLAFEVPHRLDANLVLIGTGTGIAPFRAFVKHIHSAVPDWTGRIWLFYGARSGLELLYMNDEKDDFDQYYDRDTFEAFQALSPRPHWDDAIAWKETIDERGAELVGMLERPDTYVYVAGLEPMRDELDKVFSGLLGSEETWARRKAEVVAGGRWVELLY